MRSLWAGNMRGVRNSLVACNFVKIKPEIVLSISHPALLSKHLCTEGVKDFIADMKK